MQSNAEINTWKPQTSLFGYNPLFCLHTVQQLLECLLVGWYNPQEIVSANILPYRNLAFSQPNILLFLLLLIIGQNINKKNVTPTPHHFLKSPVLKHGIVAQHMKLPPTMLTLRMSTAACLTVSLPVLLLLTTYVPHVTP